MQTASGSDARRGGRWRWRRVAAWFTVLVLLVFAAAVGYAMRPAFQRELLLTRLAPYVDDLRLDHVQLTPWSLTVRGADFGLQGAHYHVGKLDLGFNPLALIERTLSIRHLYLRRTDLDLRRLASTAASGPFAGVLSSLEHGYAFKLDGVDAALGVQLAGERTMTVRLHGGGVRPHVAGELGFDVEFNPNGTQDVVRSEGTLAVHQLSEGRVRALVADVDTSVQLAALPAPQRVRTHLRIRPPPGLAGSPYHPRMRTAADGQLEPVPRPEVIEVLLALGDTPEAPGATVEINGVYRGEDGVFSGTYDWRASTMALRPLLNMDVPDIATAIGGALTIDTLAASAQFHFDARLTAPAAVLAQFLGNNPELPASLQLRSVGDARVDAATVDFAALETTLTDDSAQMRFVARLSEPLRLSLQTPLDVLGTPRALARVQVGPVPLTWLNGLLAGRTAAGALRGEYALGIDDQARIRLEAVTPTVVESGALRDPSTASATEFGLSVTPSASWSEDFLRFALNDLRLTTPGSVLATLSLKAAARQADAIPTWRHRLRATADLQAIGTLPLLASRIADLHLPPDLRLDFRGIVAQHGQTWSFEKMVLGIGDKTGARLLDAQSLQTLRVTFGADGPRVAEASGDVIALALSGLDLAWANPWLDGRRLTGKLASVQSVLAAARDGAFAIRTTAPLRIEGVRLDQDGTALLRDLSLVVTPEIAYAPGKLDTRYTGLALTRGHTRLANGSGTVQLDGLGGTAPRVTARGALDADLLALAGQPVVARALPREAPRLPMRLKLDYDLAWADNTLNATKVDARLAVGRDATLTFAVEPGLEVRTTLTAGENLARHVVGAVALDIKNLSSATVGEFVALPALSFAEINASLRVRSDGKRLSLESLSPLALDRVLLGAPAHPTFEPFSLAADAAVTVAGQVVQAQVRDFALRFGAGGAPAVAGSFEADITPSARLPLTRLKANIEADLPQLLAQPAVLPGHKLHAGEVAFRVEVDSSRRIDARMVLDKLAGSEPLAISTFELPITGEVAENGAGFDFTAPLIGRGKSGLTNANVVGHYAPQPDEPRVLQLKIASDVFYLNDILATIAAVAPERTQVTAPDAQGRTRIVLDETPDETAAWKLIPYAVVIDLAIDKLFYTDYLAFTEVGGELDLRRRRLALNGMRGRFHDSTLTFDSVTRFAAGQPLPYTSELTGHISDFDLNQFFTELVPGEKPRIEGLFGVDVKAHGEFPNFTQLRNRLLFDVKMQSRDGVYRPLTADSPIAIASSDFLGTVGEGLSYLPTGGFGAGAVARLVNYIAEIDYDTVDIHLVREVGRDIEIRQFMVLSPTIALTATGGIKREPGVDLLDSPLDVIAHLDMLGRGAAILYSLNLMQDAKNEFGYWKGPEYRVWGTLSAPQSNLSEIVQRAGDATVKGGITRPFSGLIGNLKYRWFSDDSKAKEAARAARRAGQAGENARDEGLEPAQ